MEESLYWSRFSNSVSQFCLGETKKINAAGNALVNSAVGSELEWCGSQTLLFMTADLFVSHNNIIDLESHNKSLQSRLIQEDSAQSLLKKQLSEVSQAAEDTTWALQGKLADAKNRIIHLELDKENLLKGSTTMSMGMDREKERERDWERERIVGDTHNGGGQRRMFGGRISDNIDRHR